MRTRRGAGFDDTDNGTKSPSRPHPAADGSPENALHARCARLFGGTTPAAGAHLPRLVRGAGAWVFDAAGRRYLDCRDTTPPLGYGHPAVHEAMAAQATTLHGPGRFLDDHVLDYAERLLASFAPHLGNLRFTASAAAARDFAIAVARSVTGKRGILVADAGDGDTCATVVADALAPAAEAHHLALADGQRMSPPLSGDALRGHCLARLDAAIDALRRSAAGFAGILVCPLFARAGLPHVPPGYMAAMVERVRLAGGLVIADETRTGFGRGGCLWGHALVGFAPDLVVLGRSMANGHALAAVVARPELFASEHGHPCFAAHGGDPLHCAIADAVLGVIAQDHLADQARALGDYLRDGCTRLAGHHAVIGRLRGHGLALGVELVGVSDTGAAAARGVAGLAEHGVLVDRRGAHGNVLTLYPPLTCGEEHLDLLLEALGDVLPAIAAPT